MTCVNSDSTDTSQELCITLEWINKTEKELQEYIKDNNCEQLNELLNNIIYKLAKIDFDKLKDFFNHFLDNGKKFYNRTPLKTPLEYSELSLGHSLIYNLHTNKSGGGNCIQWTLFFCKILDMLKALGLSLEYEIFSEDTYNDTQGRVYLDGNGEWGNEYITKQNDHHSGIIVTCNNKKYLIDIYKNYSGQQGIISELPLNLIDKNGNHVTIRKFLSEKDYLTALNKLKYCYTKVEFRKDYQYYSKTINKTRIEVTHDTIIATPIESKEGCKELETYSKIFAITSKMKEEMRNLNDNDMLDYLADNLEYTRILGTSQRFEEIDDFFNKFKTEHIIPYVRKISPKILRQIFDIKNK